MNQEEQNLLSEQDFAQAVIDYVKNNDESQLKNMSEGGIPDLWVAKHHGSIERITCGVHHGLFDHVFSRGAIIPSNWDGFEGQYRTPEADLVERIHKEAQEQRVADWTPEVIERNSFSITKDFWSDETQIRNFQNILKTLEEKGLLTEPTRIYSKDQGTVGVKIGDRVVDLPGSYRNLHLLAQSLQIGTPYEMDIPQIKKYGDIVPAIYMIGKTVDVWDERVGEHKDKSPRQKLFDLVAKHSHPTPKFQSIIHVMTEEKAGEVVPRIIGQMNAFMLEFHYGSASGSVLGGMSYTVPQADLTDEEKNSLFTSRENWKMHQKSILEYHPEIMEEK